MHMISRAPELSATRRRVYFWITAQPPASLPRLFLLRLVLALLLSPTARGLRTPLVQWLPAPARSRRQPARAAPPAHRFHAAQSLPRSPSPAFRRSATASLSTSAASP